MARQVITKLIEDLDGSTADETVTFGFEGVVYTIDLNSKNALKMRKALEPYIVSGTKVGRGGIVPTGRGPRGGTQSASGRDDNRLIREWAKKAGKDISDRGRIPVEIVDEYRTTKR